MGYQRISPGIYRDTATGKTVRSATTPGANGGGNKPGAGGSMNKQGQTYTGPLGSSNVTLDNKGRPTITQTGSAGQNAALGGLEGSSAAASGALQGGLAGGIFQSLWNPSAAGGPAPMSNYENAIYGQLTQGLDRQKQQEQEQLEQTLAQRGIPVGSQAYSNATADFNKRYDDVYSNARNQAVTTGTNSLYQGIGTLSGVGQAGYFQQPQVDPNAIFSTLTGADIAKKRNATDVQIANLSRGGGGGGGGSLMPSPFMSAPPGS